jgi:DNA-binding MarR family transcriptional regulator
MTDAPATERPADGDSSPVDATRSAVRGLARLARMVERSCPELSLSQYRVLARVATGDQRASLLAGRLALSKPSVTAAVDGLVERGYLIRSGVEADRRAVQLDLTPSGQQALEAADDAMMAQLERLLARCEDPGLALAGLCELVHGLDELVAARMAKGGE